MNVNGSKFPREAKARSAPGIILKTPHRRSVSSPHLDLQNHKAKLFLPFLCIMQAVHKLKQRDIHERQHAAARAGYLVRTRYPGMPVATPLNYIAFQARYCCYIHVYYLLLHYNT